MLCIQYQLNRKKCFFLAQFHHKTFIMTSPTPSIYSFHVGCNLCTVPCDTIHCVPLSLHVWGSSWLQFTHIPSSVSKIRSWYSWQFIHALEDQYFSSYSPLHKVERYLHLCKFYHKGENLWTDPIYPFDTSILRFSLTLFISPLIW